MSIIYVLIPLGLLLLAIAIGFFLWAVNNGQFDELEEQGKSILDDHPANSENQNSDRD